MPEVSQIFFSHKELLELLIRKANVHEGKWTLSMNFGFTAGNFGPSPDQMSPGAIIIAQQVGIQRALPDTPPEVTLDAAKINSPKK